MAANSFPIDAAQLVGLFMESVLYGKDNHSQCPAKLTPFLPGVYLVSFFNCIRTLVWFEGRFKSWHDLNYMMLLAAILMFMFATLDVAFHLRHNLEAFIYFRGDPVEEFDQTADWINVIAMVFYVLQTFVGDSILIFRCWVVYDRNWLVVAAPICLWLATTVCGIMTIYTEATINSSSRLLNSSLLKPFITSMLCLTMATNTLTTSLIVYRIWGVQKSLKQGFAIVPNPRLTRLLFTLIESGLLYTFSVIVLFILYIGSNNGQYGVSNAGITFNLMITSADRNRNTSTHSSFHRSHPSIHSFQGGPGMHMPVNIKTTVSRFADPVTPVNSLFDLEKS
ncbi:hypothetical protein CVT26_002806 [Gymnopilus dilepis]|uniref:Uncharacterized protein n=1 Tax=Gymnopilus dilepis TaxID=231916 RepID=A0A409Y396_9AGAR|nr:hypothetical protein CVT26_002806 [Gymnopilus dilepis]